MSGAGNDTTRKASAVLQDVFRLSGRGTVIVVGEIEGVVKVGDELTVGACASKVMGIEMIRYSEPQKKPPDTVGLWVSMTDADALRAEIGQNVRFNGPE